MTRLRKIGLTGGIACGKSTVLRRWEDAGAAGIDTDVLAHQTLERGTPMWQGVVGEFGRGILNADESVNRARLGEIVFADEAARQKLNSIVHPAVRRMWAEALEELGRDGHTRVAVVSIPLLYEVGAENEFDCVVVVACSELTQLARLAAKGLNEEQARVRIRAQWPIQKKMDRADYVIWNDGALAHLQRQADKIWATIKENHHAP